MYAPYSKAYRVFIFSAYHTFRIYLLPFMYHGNILRFLQVHAWSYDTQSKCLMNIWEKTDFFAFKWFSVSSALKNDFFSAAVSVLFRFVLSIKWPFFESKSYYTQSYTVSWSHFKHTHFTCSSVLLLLLVINFSLAGFLPSLYLCRISEFGFGSNSNSNDGVEVTRTLHILCAFRCVSVAQLNMVRIWCECVIAGTIVFRKNCIACTQKSASMRILYTQPIWCCCLSSVNIHVEPVIYSFFFLFVGWLKMCIRINGDFSFLFGLRELHSCI